MDIVPYKSSDAHNVANFFRRIFVELDMTERPSDYMNEPHLLFQLPDKGMLLVAKDKDEVIGTVGAILLDTNEARIKRFYLDKNYRGSGLAQDLLEELKNSAKSLGIKKLILDVSKNNKRAIRFYEKTGFIPTKVTPIKDWPESSQPKTHFYFSMNM